MNENARKWVEALRSGEYKQTKSYLRTKKGFCCLGVACDLYAKETGEGEWNDGSDGTNIAGSSYWYAFISSKNKRKETAGLPVYVMEWLGIRDQLGDYSKKVDVHFSSPVKEMIEYSSLGGMNDTGSSFAEIADVIESEPGGLFHE